MNKSIALLLSICIFSFVANAADETPQAPPPAAKQETITIVADTWCPYNCDPKSPNQGFMVDIAKQAFAKHNIAVEYSVMPWTRAIEETRNGQHSAIVGSAIDDAPDFVFPTIPQGISHNNFYVKKGNPWRYTGIDSLKSVVLGVIADYSYNDELNDYLKKYKLNPTYVEMMSGDNALGINLSRLERGKLGAVIESKYVMEYYLSKHHMAGRIEEAGTLPSSEKDRIFIAFSPKNKHLSQKYADILSQEMANMRAGELKKILDTYGLNDWK